MTTALLPIPGRDCGECSACCIALRIEEDKFEKHADEPCPHLCNGCSIYATRPNVCRTWYCGWRYMEGLDELWRPDLSKILLRLQGGDRSGLILQTLSVPQDVLTTSRTLELVGSLIENNMPVFISVPGKAGHCSAILEITQRLAPAVEARNLAEAQAAMRGAVEHALRLPTNPLGPLHPAQQQRRLELCACGSGKRFKHCHGKS